MRLMRGSSASPYMTHEWHHDPPALVQPLMKIHRCRLVRLGLLQSVFDDDLFWWPALDRAIKASACQNQTQGEHRSAPPACYLQTACY